MPQSKITYRALIALFSIMLYGQAALAQRSSHDLDLAGMDRTASPCQDMWRYANGKWLKRSPIPADRDYWGVDTEIEERNLALLHQILNQAAQDKSDSPNSITLKVGDFYESGMDEQGIDTLGATPLQPEFARIAAIHDRDSLEAEIAHLHRIGVDAAFSFSVDQDDKDSTQEIIQLYQGGLGLPDRDYYLSTDPDKAKLRPLYLAHVTKMLHLLGDPTPQATQEAKTVMALETRLARASMTQVEQRDPEAIYHKMSLEQLNALTPSAEWQPYFTAVSLPHPTTMIIGQPLFFTEVARMMQDVPLSDWQIYLRWHLIHSVADALSAPFDGENFHFYSTILDGVTKRQPRWKRVEAMIDAEMGEALGQLYVARAFRPEAKARALTMVTNLKSALHDDIQILPWMGSSTRQHALEKLAVMHVKIGYPNKWRDYSKLSISRSSYVTNILNANAFEFQRDLNKLGKPVDRTEWGMTPPTVNAYYSSEMNEIVFPAGILQPPYFDPQADDAINYGEMGATIGHEMTHAFDDQGRQYDAKGNLKNWWTAQDEKNFRERAAQIVRQYHAYLPMPGHPINGELTLGENIADIGGLKIAYLAFEKSLRGKSRRRVDGFTPEQRFFIAYAQSWRGERRPASARVSLITDPHSPEKYRVIGPLADLPEFYTAFGRRSPQNTAEVW